MLGIVGYGNHVQKNIIPALSRMNLKEKYIFVRHIPEGKEKEQHNFILDYDLMLKDKDVTHVYIATPISSHFELAKRAIMAKKNVLVEKPMTLSSNQCITLFQLSKKYDCYLEEVVMYKYHSQFKYIKSLIASGKYGELITLKTKFFIPHLDNKNIRYNKSLGGGALYDVGFYPLSAIQLIDSKIKFIKGFSHSIGKYEVDLNGCAIFSDGNRYGIAEWSIGRPYTNEIKLEFEQATINIERAFSKPHDLKTKCLIKIINEDELLVMISECDHFVEMLRNFTSRPIKYVPDVNHTISRIDFMNEILNENK